MGKYLSVSCVCGCILVAITGLSWGFEINPGNWEITTTVTMPMLPQPQVSTTTECITREKARQDPLAAINKAGHCRALARKEQGNSLDFKVECQQRNMVSHGVGHYVADGNTMSGFMEIRMDMPAMPAAQGMPVRAMQVKTSWKGRRLGPCQPSAQ